MLSEWKQYAKIVPEIIIFISIEEQIKYKHLNKNRDLLRVQTYFEIISLFV